MKSLSLRGRLTLRYTLALIVVLMLRVAIIVLGLAWLAAGLVTFVRRPALQPLGWTCLGAGVVYYCTVRPRRGGRGSQRTTRLAKTSRWSLPTMA